MEYNKICKNTHKVKKEKKTTDFRQTTSVFPGKRFSQLEDLRSKGIKKRVIINYIVVEKHFIILRRVSA